MLSVMSQLRALKADTGADINVEGAQRFGCLLLKGRNAVLGGDCVRAQFPARTLPSALTAWSNSRSIWPPIRSCCARLLPRSRGGHHGNDRVWTLGVRRAEMTV